jgi:transcriptional regulator with XRE-family HTH domain
MKICEVSVVLHKRIKEVRTRLKMTQKDFGDKLGVSRDVIANIECDRVKPQKMFIQLLCATFSVNQDWLETGEGNVFLNDDKRLNELAGIFRSLNPDFQEYALKQIELLLELQKKQKGTGEYVYCP